MEGRIAVVTGTRGEMGWPFTVLHSRGKLMQIRNKLMDGGHGRAPILEVPLGGNHSSCVVAQRGTFQLVKHGNSFFVGVFGPGPTGCPAGVVDSFQLL